MDKEKRIYSLTMAAFIIHEGCEEYEIKRDEVDKDKCYFVFPQTEEVADIIFEYQNTKTIYVDLRKYNRIYKGLKQEIYKMRMEEK